MPRTFPEQVLAGVLAALMAIVSPQFAAAQPQSQEVRFETFDRVELKGTFYPSGGANKAACVLLLHKLGGSRTQEGWDDLAKKLQAKGFAVLSFDFRGHGDSTAVDPDVFWQNSVNPRAFKVSKDNRDKINAADFGPKKNYYYAPMLINDIEAAKHYLYSRNNSNDCNASNLILIGAEDGAALGSLWLWTQFRTPRLVPNPFTGGVMPDPRKTDGEDVAACVWLSMPFSFGATRVPVSSWLATARPPIGAKVVMDFFFGDKDKAAAQTAKSLAGSLKAVAVGSKVAEGTKASAVKNTKAVGNDLLKSSLPTNDEICDFLKVVVDKRGNVAWEKRAQVPLQFIPVAPFFTLQ